MNDTQLIYKKMIAITKDIEAIGKNQQNVTQKFKFRGIDDIYNNLHDLFSKHEVFVTMKVIDNKSEISITKDSYSQKEKTAVRVTATFEINFYAADGSFVTATIPSEGIDYGDKATNKTISAAMKYALITTFLIPTDDIDDGDKESPEIPNNYNSLDQKFTEINDYMQQAINISDLQNRFVYCKTEIGKWGASKIISPYYNKLIAVKDCLKKRFEGTTI